MVPFFTDLKTQSSCSIHIPRKARARSSDSFAYAVNHAWGEMIGQSRIKSWGNFGGDLLPFMLGTASIAAACSNELYSRLYF